MHRSVSRSTYTLAALLLAALVLAAGCTKLSIPGTAPAPSSGDTSAMPTPKLQEEAFRAWMLRDYQRSELYHLRLLDRTDLPAADRPVVLDRLAWSAFYSQHYHQARIALEELADLDKSVQEKWAWHDLYLRTLQALDKPSRIQDHLDWVLTESGLPWDVRYNTGLWYARLALSRGEYSRAVGVLDEFYAQAPDAAARSLYETGFSEQLQDASDKALDGMAKSVTAGKQFQFPYALIVFERARRHADDARIWPAAWRTMRDIVAEAGLADTTKLADQLAELEKVHGVPRVGVALALPLTGPYGRYAWKIVSGVGAAQWRLANQGVDLDVAVINTDASDWIKRLDALPPHYAVVGGPLRVEDFKSLGDSGFLKKRAVFSFLPELGDFTEGRDAWRFFSSPRDQVRSLVSMTMNQLGITHFGVLYPDEKFGKHMSKLFFQEVAARGGSVTGMESYPPERHTEWGKSVAKVLRVPSDFGENKENPLDPPDFGAVFLPDGWSQARQLAPQFFFYEADSLVLLGPELWSRALDSSHNLEDQYFRLAVCPGSWWADSDGARDLQDALEGGALGRADFWAALGYDFLRFASGLGSLPANWTPSDVNARIVSAMRMRFSMAPLVWDEHGMARQDLYLFTPKADGKQLVDTSTLTGRIERALARREKRLEAYRQRLEEERGRQNPAGQKRQGEGAAGSVQ